LKAPRPVERCLIEFPAILSSSIEPLCCFFFIETPHHVLAAEITLYSYRLVMGSSTQKTSYDLNIAHIHPVNNHLVADTGRTPPDFAQPISSLSAGDVQDALCISQADFNKTTICNMRSRLSVPIGLPKYEPRFLQWLLRCSLSGSTQGNRLPVTAGRISLCAPRYPLEAYPDIRDRLAPSSCRSE
jgi:hypothetical protein